MGIIDQIEKQRMDASPVQLTGDSVGKFFKTRGGWLAKVIHHEYENVFFCIHMLGHDGKMRSDPVKHERGGMAWRRGLPNHEAPIPIGTHPADLVEPTEFIERFAGTSYVISHNGVCWKWEPKV